MYVGSIILQNTTGVGILQCKSGLYAHEPEAHVPNIACGKPGFRNASGGGNGRSIGCHKNGIKSEMFDAAKVKN
jgi:hypothetical protein